MLGKNYDFYLTKGGKPSSQIDEFLAFFYNYEWNLISIIINYYVDKLVEKMWISFLIFYWDNSYMVIPLSNQVDLWKIVRRMTANKKLSSTDGSNKKLSFYEWVAVKEFLVNNLAVIRDVSWNSSELRLKP